MTDKQLITDTEFDTAVADVFQRYPNSSPYGTHDDLSRRRKINDVLTATRAARISATGESHIRRRRFTAWAVAAAAVMVVAAFAALFFAQSHKVIHTRVIVENDTYYGEIQEKDGSVLLGETPASRHAPIPVGKSVQTPNGTALLRLPTGIDWWMAPSGNGKIHRLDKNRLEVAVQSGESWFRVDPTREGPAFSVGTRLGRIAVTGTIFVVRATPSDVTVTLLEGKVVITRFNGEHRMVQSGYTILLGDGKQIQLTTEELQQYYQQLAELDWVQPAVAEGSEMGEVRLSGGRGESQKGEHPPAVSPMMRDAKADMQQLHEEILASRKRGDWHRTAALYTKLIQAAPGSETAMVSRVSLGEIYLTRLHRYADALYQYNRYIRTGHSVLLPEALYGKCRSLKLLDKTDDEKHCLLRFVQQFPGVLQADDAKSRLAQIKQDSP